ncbi:hypothetical protein VNO80_21859 [Phaseolus coccineus]|uniref:Uncharacterized protein n=1 Tax=Phaseolus coccineus TaxID=3886 RepID=A0AAN9QTR0_PHACN
MQLGGAAVGPLASTTAVAVPIISTFRSGNRFPVNAEELRNQMQILEQREKSLSEAQAGDKKGIQRLEKELLNCSQEIDYLQDLLSARNADVNYLEERVHSLELKLEGMEVLQEEVFSLREELKRFSSKQFSLIQELDHKEIELEKSALSMEKLEDLFSSIALESQFEVESMKLDMMALEQSLFEAKKIQEETLDENNKMSRSIEELQVALQDAQKTILSLSEENGQLKEKLDTANKTSKIYSQKDEQGNNSTIAENTSTSVVHGPHVGRSVVILDPAADLKSEMEMSQQIQEYECLVKKLKEELREEKLRAKEEAEDLVQEMAELRYQFTSLLEEECKRRACFEHASLQRIADLEAQAGTLLIRPQLRMISKTLPCVRTEDSLVVFRHYRVYGWGSRPGKKIALFWTKAQSLSPQLVK